MSKLIASLLLASLVLGPLSPSSAATGGEAGFITTAGVDRAKYKPDVTDIDPATGVPGAADDDPDRSFAAVGVDRV